MSTLGILLTAYIVSALVCFIWAVVGKIDGVKHSAVVKFAVIGTIPLLGTLLATVFSLVMAIETLGNFFRGKK